VVNLSWKLASVLHGTGPESLLDTYEPERRPTAAGVLGFTAQLTALAELSQPTLMRLRDQLIGAAAGIPEVPGYLAGTMSQLAVGYPGPGADDRIGLRVPPDGPWASTLRWTLLLPPSCGHTAESLGAPDGVQIGHTETTEALLVRPDGYLAASSAELDESALGTLLGVARTWPDPR
jgi:FAD binding domain